MGKKLDAPALKEPTRDEIQTAGPRKDSFLRVYIELGARESCRVFLFCPAEGEKSPYPYAETIWVLPGINLKQRYSTFSDERKLAGALNAVG